MGIRVLVGILAAAVCAVALAAERSEEFLRIKHGNAALTGVISEAVTKDDFAAIQEAAGKISQHPHFPKADSEVILAALGDEGSHFQENYAKFRETAQSLADAAEFEDVKEVQTLYLKFMQDCIACHNEYREIVRRKRAEAETAAK
ncbi:MAG: cytochrome c [Pseudomonadota bacterium]